MVEYILHVLRRMCERAERLAAQLEERVLGGHEGAADWVARRVAEYEKGLRVVGGRCQKPVIIGVTADYAVQHDDVRRLHVVRSGGDVHDAAVHAIAHPCLRGKLPGLGVVRVDQLEVGGGGRAAAEQLELDLAGAATDLQDGCAVDADAVKKVDDALLSGIQASTSVAARLVGGEARSEHVFTPAGVTAASHPLIFSHSTVPGGLDVTSSTIRFTSRTSFVMRVEIRAKTSSGSRKHRRP